MKLGPRAQGGLAACRAPMKNCIFCIDELCKARARETFPQILILIFAFPLFHSETIQLCQTSFALVLVKKPNLSCSFSVSSQPED